MQRFAGGLLSSAITAALLGVLPHGDARADDLRSGTHVDPRLGSAVRSAITLAASRLRNPECLAILEDFRDGTSGHPLADRLAETGQTASEYLSRWITYTSGLGLPPCESSEKVAYTSPGIRVVFVCHDQFLAASRRSEGLAANLLIHEALHTLGLGENPPDSKVITARVQARCGP